MTCSISVTLAIRLVNDSYLSFGKDWGPWLLGIIKIREILQAVRGRADIIPLSPFAWTLVVFVPKGRVLW